MKVPNDSKRTWKTNNVKKMDLHDNYKIKIENYCKIVRDVIVKSKNDTHLLKDFPFGCCRNSSIIIGQILKDYGAENVHVCRKEIDDMYASHAWIEFDNWIIDITADQFGTEFSPVLVLSQESPYWFHKKSNGEPCNFSIVGMDAPYLFKDYELIKNEIENFIFNF